MPATSPGRRAQRAASTASADEHDARASHADQAGQAAGQREVERRRVGAVGLLVAAVGPLVLGVDASANAMR